MTPHVPGDDSRRWSGHRVYDRSDGCGRWRIQERAALCRLARPGAAATFHRRQDPSWPHHQNGQLEIRKLLLLRATSMVRRAAQWNSAAGIWTRAVLQRRPVRLVTVALANKMARIAWALMTRKEVYHAKGRITVPVSAIGRTGRRVRKGPTDTPFSRSFRARMIHSP